MVQSVAFIGLGRMGLPMARHLLAAGYPLTVFNRTRERCAELERQGATVATTPRAAAAGAEVVFTAVFDSAAVEAVTVGPDGVLAGVRPGAVLVDLSTISPDSSARVAAAAQAARVRFLRSPILGSVVQAEEGSVGLIISGEEATYREVEAVLRVFGPRHFYVGTGELARYMKLALNLMVGTTMQMLAEALVFTEKAGLDRAAALGVLTSSGAGSPLVKRKATRLAHDDYQPEFTIKLIQKDFDLALEAGSEIGAPLPVMALVHQLQGMAINRGLGDLDGIAVHLLMEQLAGLAAPPATTIPGGSGDRPTGQGGA